MMNGREASMLTLFILSDLPDEVTVEEAQSIVLASGEVEPMAVAGGIEQLEKAGLVAVRDGFLSVTRAGQETASSMEDKKKLCRSAIHRAMREYKRLTCGIDYRLSTENAHGGSFVHFSVYVGELKYFETSLFFAKASEALAVYNRMDEDPERFYKGFLTVATGEDLL